MKNRDSLIGIIVFDNVSRYKELSKSPFFMIDQNKLAVALDKENTDEDTALRVACVFARQLALQISTNSSSSREKIDVSSIKSELETIYGSINNLRSIRIANSKAKNKLIKLMIFLGINKKQLLTTLLIFLKSLMRQMIRKQKKND